MSNSAPSLYRRTVSSKLHLKRKIQEEAKEKEAKDGEAEQPRTIVELAPIPISESTAAQSSTPHDARTSEQASTSGKNPVNTL